MNQNEKLRNCLEQLYKDFEPVREKIQKAIDASPNKITFKAALEQVNNTHKKLAIQKLPDIVS